MERRRNRTKIRMTININTVTPDEQLDNDPPIRVGDIVFVDLADINSAISFVGKIFALTAGHGAAVSKNADIIKSVALDRCYHATQAQKRQYFKKLLKDG